MKGLKVYKIKKGKHRASGLNFGINFKKYKETWVNFTDSCWYEKENGDSEDLNKLFGFGTSLNHHKNSVRFAWKPDFENKGVIEIYAYQYNGGERQFKHVTDVPVNKNILYTISLDGLTSEFNIYNPDDEYGIHSVEMKYPLSNINVGFKLFPYFGGDNKSPQTMRISFVRA